MADADRKPSIFLSYGRGDDSPDYDDVTGSFMRRLYNALTAAGHAVWWDRESMPSRALTFLQEIRDAVEAHDRVVLVVGPHAMQSHYVRAEWQYALSICKPVIPILRLGDYPLIPAELTVHAPDFREARDEANALAELKRILSEPEIPMGRLHGVPAPPTWYVKREQLLERLAQAVCEDIHRPVVTGSKKQMVALHGMGGLGKTTLATALCRECEVRRAFPDGIFWVEIGQTPQIATRLGDIGHAFGDDRAEYPDESRGRSRLTSLLEDKAVLLVLDDVWDHRHAEVFRILGSRGRLLLTTRRERVVTQLGAVSIRGENLTEDEALTLMAERLGRPRADLPAECADIAREVGRHALAVSVAAGHLSERGGDFAPKLLERLRQRREGENPFKDLALSDDDKNQNLELSLSLSYEDLTGDLQRRFRLLGALAPDGTFDRGAAEAVWEDSDPDEADDSLNTLARAGLLTDERNGRYSQHGLLRTYAHALLVRQGELADAQERHFAHYFAKHGDFDANNHEDRHPEILQDFDNLRQALTWGFEHDGARACDLAVALKYFMQLQVALTTQKDIFESALKAARSAGYAGGEAYTLKALGDVALTENAYAAAREYYERTLPLYEQIGDRLGQANALKALGDVARMENAYAAAREHYERALPLYEQIGDRLGQANALKALGDVARMEDAYAAAREYYERALRLTEQIGNRLGQANALKALGDVALTENAYGAAREYYERVLPLYERIGDRLGQANALQALGDVARMENAHGAAREYYERALRLTEQIGARLGQAHTLQALGDVARMENAHGAAREYYERALRLTEQIGDRLGQAHTLHSLGDVARMENAHGAAREYYERALPLYQTIGERAGQLNTLHSLALLEKAEGNTAAACEWFGQLFAIAEAHPFFREHPVVQRWRREAQETGCG